MIPVTVLTGFLGSGKTTLLNLILTQPRFADSAIVVNEFGEIDIDGALVRHVDERLVATTTGCLCCTVRGDVREALLDLYERRRMGEIPAFRRLIVETTGLADPAPVLHTLMSDHLIGDRYSLGGVVTTVDALHGASTFEKYAESVKQVAIADRLVLTKTDLIHAPQRQTRLTAIRSILMRLNPSAPILDPNHHRFSLYRLFDSALFKLSAKQPDVRRWLNEAAYDADHEGLHDHHAHELDVNRHNESIRAFCLTFDRPFAMDSFVIALQRIVALHGENLLRMKGIVRMKERPETPIVLHGVQHMLHPMVWLERWPDDGRRSKLVFITRNVTRAAIGAIFALEGMDHLGPEASAFTAD